jgi:hypothetical protein
MISEIPVNCRLDHIEKAIRLRGPAKVDPAEEEPEQWRRSVEEDRRLAEHNAVMAGFYRAINEAFPLLYRQQGAAAVYQHFGAFGRLLYVGISTNPRQRQRPHAGDARYGEPSPWAVDVVRIAAEWHPTYEEAAVAEIRAIASEQPLHKKRRKSPALSLMTHSAIVTGSLGISMVTATFTPGLGTSAPGLGVRCGTATVN